MVCRGNVILFVGLVLLEAGCSLVPYMTPQEKCAARGMVLSGVAESEDYSVGVAHSGKHHAVATASSRGETVFCREVAPTDDRCLLEATQASALLKADFDDYGRRLLVVFGYCVFIAPGIILQVSFHANAVAAEEEAAKKFRATLDQCRQVQAPRQETQAPADEVPPIPEGMEAKPFELKP
jgi:hypothetical protein